MIKTEALTVALEELAERFEKASQPSDDMIGWGQFLDSPKQHFQIGSYGTSAGLIVLSLAGRQDSPTSKQATKLLCHLWKLRKKSPQYKKRFAQNLRLAHTYLAIRLTGGSITTQAQLEKEIFRRHLRGKGWGDWWVTSSHHDQTSKPFSSCLMILSLILFREDNLSQEQTNILDEAAEYLSGCFVNRDLSTLERRAVLTTVECYKSYRDTAYSDPKYRLHLDEITFKSEKYGVYFFFYEFPEQETGKSFGRDYFLLPPAMLTAIGGFQKQSKGNQRILSEQMVDELLMSIGKDRGAYRAKKHDHLSTIDQAWLAILLASAIRCMNKKYTPPGLFSLLNYQLTREREPGFLVDTLIPIFAVLLAAVASTIPIVSQLQRVLITLCTLSVAGMYGPSIIRKLLPGRK